MNSFLLVKNEHERSKSELRVFFTLQCNYRRNNNIMTNQVGIDMNSDSDSDDLLQYNPNRLLDTLIENLRLKNDAALSRALKWRHRSSAKSAITACRSALRC